MVMWPLTTQAYFIKETEMSQSSVCVRVYLVFCVCVVRERERETERERTHSRPLKQHLKKQDERLYGFLIWSFNCRTSALFSLSNMFHVRRTQGFLLRKPCFFVFLAHSLTHTHLSGIVYKADPTSQGHHLSRADSQHVPLINLKGLSPPRNSSLKRFHSQDKWKPRVNVKDKEEN